MSWEPKGGSLLDPPTCLGVENLDGPVVPCCPPRSQTGQEEKRALIRIGLLALVKDVEGERRGAPGQELEGPM